MPGPQPGHRWGTRSSTSRTHPRSPLQPVNVPHGVGVSVPARDGQDMLARQRGDPRVVHGDRCAGHPQAVPNGRRALAALGFHDLEFSLDAPEDASRLGRSCRSAPASCIHGLRPRPAGFASFSARASVMSCVSVWPVAAARALARRMIGSGISSVVFTRSAVPRDMGRCKPRNQRAACVLARARVAGDAGCGCPISVLQEMREVHLGSREGKDQPPKTWGFLRRGRDLF